MKLQLREIFQVTGMHLPVSYSIPLSELEDVHGYTFAEPIAGLKHRFMYGINSTGKDSGNLFLLQ